MKISNVAIDTISAHPQNVRQGDIGAIVTSLEAHGQYRPLIVQKSTGFILAGNHTWRAAAVVGLKKVDIVELDVDDDEALRILLVDNRTNDLATYDQDALKSLLEVLARTEKQLEGTGFDLDDLDNFIFDAERELDFKPDDTEQPRLDEVTPLSCPNCSFQWRKGKGDAIIPL